MSLCKGNPSPLPVPLKLTDVLYSISGLLQSVQTQKHKKKANVV